MSVSTSETNDNNYSRPSAEPVRQQEGPVRLSALQSKAYDDATNGVDPRIEEAFRLLDKKSYGRLDSSDLLAGLATYEGMSLTPETIMLLAGMYESEATGGLDIIDFGQLHNSLMKWYALFQKHDIQQQDYIVHHSLCAALTELGYKLDRQTTRQLIRKLGRQAKYLQPDGFIRICCLLKRLTDTFKEKDLKKNKTITVSYYEALHMSLSSCF